MADSIILTKNNKTITLPIGKNVNYSKERIKELAVENSLITANEAINFDYTFDKLSGTFSERYYELDFDDITVAQVNIPLLSKIRSIKRLNITGTKCNFTVKDLTHFSGDINIYGTRTESIDIFGYSGNATTHIASAKGQLNIANIKKLYLLQGTGGNHYEELYPNVLDIRNVDTTYCEELRLMSYHKSSCDIIIGQNYTNLNVDYMIGNSYLDLNASPIRGRRLIIVSNIPPILKNCRYDYNSSTGKYDIQVDAHDYVGSGESGALLHRLNDWVSRGNFESILVPEDAYEDYINDVFVENGTIGKTGWSYYGPSGVQYGGRDIITTYEDGEYEPTEEWLYRKDS